MSKSHTQRSALLHPQAFFILLILVSGVVYIALGRDRGPSSGPRAAALPAPDRVQADRVQKRLDAQAEQLAELARQVEELRIVRPSGVARESVEPAEPVNLAGMSAVEERLAALESAVAAGSERQRAEGVRAPEETDAERRAREQGEVQKQRAIATDATRTDEERVRALGLLRFRKDEFGDDARSPAVVAAMIAIAQASSDEEVRSDIWRQLDGSTDAALRDPLLWALQYDPSGDVRSEAAESLGAFCQDPAVAAALRLAAENDPDSSVRKEASGSLDG